MAVFGELAVPTKLPRLLRAQIQPTKLEKLPVVREAAQIAGFGQDGQCQDRAHPRQRPEAMIIWIAGEFLIGPLLQRGPGRTELLMVLESEPKGLDGLGVLRHGQANTVLGRGIEVIQEAPFINLPPDNRPSFLSKGCLRVARDRGGARKAVQETAEPL